MDVKKKLTQLYKEASVYAREAYGKRNHISDCCYATEDDVIEYLIANGITITPAVPGHSEDDHNIMELCFRNGERHMKEKVGKELTKIAEHMPCITLAQALAMLEGL